jgi:phosphate transport system substrate-binding protein
MYQRFIKQAFVGAAMLSMALSGVASASGVSEISGAGSSFAYPIYSKWAESYNHKTGVKMNYQSIGSGGGIKQIEAKTVDFGASDAPLKADVLKSQGMMQFPMAMGGVIPVVNLPGIKAGELKLSAKVLAEIYMGEIKKWDDSRIKALNEHLKLPSTAITVVHRSDASGTTWIFTNYLTKVSKEWASKLGNNTSVAWPAGVGGKGNPGVASYVNRIKGSIGYVEYAYVMQNHMTYAKLKNREGRFVSPTAKNFQAAASHADWSHAPGFYMVLTNQPGKDSWPITGATFVLVHTTQEEPATGEAVLKFFDWSYHHGSKLAEELAYVPMPSSVARMVEQEWAKSIKDTSGNPVWKMSMKQ